MPPNPTAMSRDEICACLDKAIEHLLAGDYVSATAGFQRILDESGDPNALPIAHRYLKWWCFPVDSMVTELEATLQPMSLGELLAKHLGSDAPPDYAQQVSETLQKVSTVCCLGGQVWIHRSCLEATFGLLVTRLREGGLPITLDEMADLLLAELGCQELLASECVVNSIGAELTKADGILILKDGCILDESNLEFFQTELVESISKKKKPLKIDQVLGRMPWRQSVKAALQPRSLRTWLYSQRGREENLCELGDGWWFITGLLDLSDAAIEEVFKDQFDTPDTQTIVLRYLFGKSQPQVSSFGSLVQSASKQLARNPSLIEVEDGRWFLVKAVNDLVGRMVDHLGQHNHPIGIEELLRAVRPSGQRRFFISDSVLACLVSKLREDDRVLEVCETTWLHRSAMDSILERVYKLLQDSTARSVSEILSECLWVPIKPRRCHPTFVKGFESALHLDIRFSVDPRWDLWSAIPPGNPKNDLAYVVLYHEHRPLTRQQIVDQAKNMPHRQSLDFQLEVDKRFKRMTDGRWMLEQWILINDLAASYLAQSPIPLLAETVRQRVCQAHSIPVNSAIFEPEGDPRFVRAPLGKWTCPSPGIIVTTDMLERLVVAAGNATEGISLEVLTRRSLRDDPSAFIDLEQVLEADGRLVHCNDLWYPRDKCFYSVTSDDLERIKSHIEAVGYPVPTETLAQVCLNRFACLADLGEKLGETEHFIELGSSGWIVRDLQLESRTRGREVNYPIRSGKYLPIIDPAEFESIEEEYSEIPHDLPAKASDEWKEESRVRSISIALSFEDLRDGTLVVTSRLRSLLGDGIDLPALRFVDESGAGFSCWYDAEDKLLSGFGRWFGAQGFTFGDKVRLSVTNRDDQFLVQAVGERNEQVHLEGIRRSNVQSLIDEAKRVNRSYHDLALEVFEHFGIPLHIDDLWGMVNYRRTARKGTISAILSNRSYFVSEGAGYWRFDKEEYARMIRDLERKVRKLERENQKLRDKSAESGTAHNERLQRKLEELEAQLKTSQKSFNQHEREIGDLRREVDAAKKRASDAEAAASQAREQNSQLQKSLSDARQRINELSEALETETSAVLVLEEERKELQERVDRLLTRIDKMARLDDDLQRSIKEARELRKQNRMIDADNERLRKEVEAFTNQVQETTTLRTEQEQLKLALTASQEALERSDSQNERLNAELEATNDSAEKSERAVNQLSEEYKQVEVSLAAIEDRNRTLTEEVQEKNETIRRINDRNQTLSGEVTSLSAQIATLNEQQSRFHDQISSLEKTLQSADADADAAKEQNKILASELAQREVEKQRWEDQLTNMAGNLESLRAEHAEASLVLNSWGGRLARWWVMIRSKDALT